MNPSLVLPELLVRGNFTQSVASSVDFERLLSKSPLEHYRFCRSLLSEARHTITLPAFANAYEAARRCPYASRYQPSIAALHVLAHILGKDAHPIDAQLFTSHAPQGDKEGIYPAHRMLPLPIAREMFQMWKEIAEHEKNDRLNELANSGKIWLAQLGKNASHLFYRENEFDENETHEDLKDLQQITYGSDDLLGIARLATASFDTTLTLSGWNSGLGVMKFDDVEIRAFGPQPFPLSDPTHFGIAQIEAHQSKITVDARHLSLQGWTRCYQDPEIWLSLDAKADCRAIVLNVQWRGLQANILSENPLAAPYAMVFYVKASTCMLEDGLTLYPKGLNRYQGKGKKIIFDQKLQVECSPILNLQVIPLAGFSCFWNTTFLVAMEFNASQDQASFSFSTVVD